MHVCVGHGSHSWFKESLFNWFADFQVLNTTYVYIKCCAVVTILHILLYPDVSIFLEETRGALRSGQSCGAELCICFEFYLSFVLCTCMCYFLMATLTEISPQAICCSQEHLAHFRRKNTHGKTCSYAQLQIASVLFRIELNTCWFNQNNTVFPMHVFLSRLFKKIKTMFWLVVHLVLCDSQLCCQHDKPCVRIQLTKQLCCSGLDRALGHPFILNQ